MSAKLTVVDEAFKPTRKRKNYSKELREALERIEELEQQVSDLESDLENERRRADEAVDGQETAEREGEVDRDRADSAESRLSDVEYLLEERETLKWRADLGIAGAQEDLDNFHEQIQEILL
jgi:predicted  nucleic acid-binding Zn-ribbon protein